MPHTTPMQTSLLGVLGLVASAAGCGGDGATTAGGGAGASAAETTATTATASGPIAVATSTSTSTSSGTSTGGGGGDPGWQPVPWFGDECQFEYATRPEHAHPPLEWAACPGAIPGCEQLVKNWPLPDGATAASAYVTGVEGGHWIAVYGTWADGKHVTTFDPGGNVTHAYRTTGCVISRLGMGPTGHWIGGMFASETSSLGRYAFQPWDTMPSSAIVATGLTQSAQRTVGYEDLFALEFGGGAIQLWDRATSQLHVSPPMPASGSSRIPHLAGADALFLGGPVFAYDGWVWTRASGFVRLIEHTAPDTLLDLRSDGTTMVWLTSTPPADGQPWSEPAVFWTAPHTTDPGMIQGTPRRPVIVGGVVDAGAAGQGHYAYASGLPQAVHVLRLSDARLWIAPVPIDGSGTGAMAVHYVDETWLYYRTSRNLFRQRLDALGPGEPAP